MLRRSARNPGQAPPAEESVVVPQPTQKRGRGRPPKAKKTVATEVEPAVEDGSKHDDSLDESTADADSVEANANSSSAVDVRIPVESVPTEGDDEERIASDSSDKALAVNDADMTASTSEDKENEARADCEDEKVLKIEEEELKKDDRINENADKDMIKVVSDTEIIPPSIAATLPSDTVPTAPTSKDTSEPATETATKRTASSASSPNELAVSEIPSAPATPLSAVVPTESTTVSITPPGIPLRPPPYEHIKECVFLAQIMDLNEYGDECMCTDGICGSECLLRYLCVECDKKCPSGRKCTNKAMQRGKGASVEVFHTGTEKGFGVRALEDIKKGRFIIEYVGEVMTEKASEKRKKEYAREKPARRHHYMMKVTDWKNKGFIIDGTRMGNEGRFFNHSCEPNMECGKFSVKKRFRMAFTAKRNIETGEELTFDYKFENYGKTMINCECGAAKCRKFMTSKKEAKEEEERRKLEEDDSDDVDDEEEEDEEEEEESADEELQIEDRDRKKLKTQQSIEDCAEQLIQKGVISKKKQIELLSVIMIRLTPAHQSLRRRLIKLLTASGEKNNEVYSVFLERNGRMIIQKYLTLGIDEDTNIDQYKELIPLLEAAMILLESIKNYTETIHESSKMAYLVPALRELSQLEAPDSLSIIDTMDGIVNTVVNDEETDVEEWSMRWQNCKSKAAELLELWKYAFTLSSSFKIPKKMRDKEKKNPSPVKSSMIRTSTFKRPIKVDERNAGWQSTVKRDKRDNIHRDKPYLHKSRQPETRSAWSIEDLKRLEAMDEQRRLEQRSKESQSSQSTDSQDDDAMSISPNIEDMEIEEDDDGPSTSTAAGPSSGVHSAVSQGVPYYLVGPALGSSLEAERDFFLHAVNHCARMAREARERLQQEQQYQRDAAAAAAAAEAAASPDEMPVGEQQPRKSVNERISEISKDGLKKKKAEFKSKAVNVIKREVRPSMFADLETFEKTLRKLIHGVMEKEEKMDTRFEYDFSDGIKNRIAKFAREYVKRHNLKAD